MNLTSQLTTLRNKRGDLTADERAELGCSLAKRLEKAGEYEAAHEALIEFWPDRNTPPNVEGLVLAVQADVFLRVGNVAGSLESADQISGSQEMAKNLITRSVEIFERLGQSEKLAEARADLAVCYWCEGEFDEARVLLKLVLNEISDTQTELKARVLVRSAIVEKTAGRYVDAVGLFKEARPFVEDTDDDALKGAFHNGLATLLNCRGLSEDRRDFIDQSLIEFAAASIHFEQAGNTRYLARVENNLGFLYYTIGRYQDAHEHLDRARKLFIKLKDVGTAAQVDETRARTLLAEGRLREAERMIKAAVRVLENSGQQAVLAEALTTQGTIVARLGNPARAAALLQRAIVVAETVGDREGSGRAHLTIVEELAAQTPLKQLAEVYGSAADLLQQSQDPATHKRLISCARIIIEAFLRVEQQAMPVLEETSWKGFSMRKEIERIEKILINRALRDAGGSVTKAAQLLGFHHHQSLISLLNSRHSELLEHRSVVRRRHRHLFSKPQHSKKKAPAVNVKNQIFVLHVEDHKPVTRLVKDALGGAYHVQSCTNGMTAYNHLLTESRVDVLIVDNNLPGMSGLELVLRVRSIVHRRNLPIIMLSRDDVEKEAWRAGIDAFVRKNDAAGQLPSTIARLLEERRKA
jgi:tetratricopeptide (TPR) repeat protein/CheY-like chemotaxis protein